jgi:hypothetical protein
MQEHGAEKSPDLTLKDQVLRKGSGTQYRGFALKQTTADRDEENYSVQHDQRDRNDGS